MRTGRWNACRPASPDQAAPSLYQNRWECLVCGYDRFHRVVVPRPGGKTYQTQFHACSRCTVMFEIPANFNAANPSPVVDVKPVTEFRIPVRRHPNDSARKKSKMMRQIHGVMNEAFSDDLADQVHRGQEGQALKGRWNGGKPYGFKVRSVFDKSDTNASGEPRKIDTVLEIDKAHAKVVLELFTRFVDGESCAALAKDLNARGIASPGSVWKRKVRRCKGWVSSAVRVIVVNPLYTGRQRWNVSQFVRDPDTGKHLRRKRPKAEWVVNQHDHLRIVSDELFERAHRRMQAISGPSARLKRGGRPSHLLSQLLRCAINPACNY